MVKDEIVKLPYIIIECHGCVQRIVDVACGKISEEGKIVLLGVIKIKTQEGVDDYFINKSFKHMSNDSDSVTGLLEELKMYLS